MFLLVFVVVFQCIVQCVVVSLYISSSSAFPLLAAGLLWSHRAFLQAWFLGTSAVPLLHCPGGLFWALWACLA